MKRFLLGLALAVSGCAAAADPYVGYVYPSAVQAGTTNTLIVCGQFLWGVQGGHVTGRGVEVLDVELVPSFAPPPGDQRKYLVKWLDAIAGGHREKPPLPNVEHLDEWRSNRWWSVLGELDDLRLSLVEQWLHTPRNPLQMTPALNQMLLARVAVEPGAELGVREFRIYGNGGLSAPHAFLVTAAPHVPEPLYVPPHRRQPERPLVETLPCVLDGQIFPGETDTFRIALKGGRTVTFRTFAREFEPFIGDAVPGFFNPVLRLLDDATNEVAVADDYFYHPDPVLVYTPPTNGVYTLRIHDNLYRGRGDFVYVVDVREGNLPPPLFDLPLTPVPPADIPVSARVAQFRGEVKEPGQVRTHVFDIPEPGEYVFDLLARRLGSPLDGRLTVRDESGRTVLARFDDTTNAVHCGTIIQGECDPVGRCRFEREGRYSVRVEDEAGKGGAAYVYTLRIHRPVPRFEVWAKKSSFSPRPGQWLPLPLQVIRRDGFDGDIRLEPDDAVEMNVRVIPAASNLVTVSIRSKAKRTPVPVPFALAASARVGGERVVVPVMPADEYNQAFAWNHLLPARSFMLKSWGPPPPPPRRPTVRRARELFNGRNLDGWYTFLKGRGRNNDPKRVFTVTNGAIRVSGEEWGSLTTADSFADYRLTVEYRWLGTSFGSKTNAAPDSGILFHSTGPDGGFAGAWMPAHEYNLIRGASGDLWTVGPDPGRNQKPARFIKGEAGPEKLAGRHPIWQKGGTAVTLAGNARLCRFDIDRSWTDTPQVPLAVNEKPMGEWNVAVLECRWGQVACWFNGKLVNRAVQCAPNMGRIQLQSEGCGIEFRRVRIEPLDPPVKSPKAAPKR
ncbi:MAG: DUF1080 domain-containing protein [Kiritimatiellia bacterium]